MLKIQELEFLESIGYLKKNEVSDKHVDYIKINKSLSELKASIEEAKNNFSSGSIDFEDVYKSIIN